MLYHKEYKHVTWGECTLRDWLNIEFLKEFTSQEQERILLTTVANEPNQWYGTDGGKPTQDRFFCLSLREAQTYLGDGKLGKAEKSLQKNRYIDDGFKDAHKAETLGKCVNSGWWWLRSPGVPPHHTACVAMVTNRVKKQ